MQVLGIRLEQIFFHRRDAKGAESDYFSFAFACIPLQRGLSKANDRKDIFAYSETLR